MAHDDLFVFCQPPLYFGTDDLSGLGFLSVDTMDRDAQLRSYPKPRLLLARGLLLEADARRASKKPARASAPEELS